MIFVLDNYDSFTYNLVQYLGELGADVVVRRNDEVTAEEIENDLRPAKILISPGPGAPREAGATGARSSAGCRSPSAPAATTRSSSSANPYPRVWKSPPRRRTVSSW